MTNPNAPGRWVPTTLIMTLSVLCMSQAVAQVNTGITNGGYETFSLAAGASSAPITIPLDVPVIVTGSVTTTGDRGVGQVAMEHSSGLFLQWVGLNSNATGTITQGYSGTAGGPIVQIDFGGSVNLVVNGTDSFVVTNNASFAVTGYVTWSYFDSPNNTLANTVLGNGALSQSPTGQFNTAAGYQALNADSSGYRNTAVGAYALLKNSNGFANTAIGVIALDQNSGGNYNTAVGDSALYSNTTGSSNTAMGLASLEENQSGTNNTAFGQYALRFNTLGGGNAAQGYLALYSNTTGGRNLGLGNNALGNNSTGSYNIGLGFQGGLSLTTGTDNIDIANVGVAGESHTLRLGTEGTTGVPGSGITRAFVAGVAGTTVTGSAVYVTASGELGVLASSERFKTDVQSMGAASEKLAQLRPVTFRLKADSEGTTQYGLIAEEVAQVYPELVIRGADGQINGVRYEELTPMLLNLVQQQQAELGAQRQRNADLAAQVRDIRLMLAAVLRKEGAAAH